MVGSNKPLRFLSLLICLNTTNQYSISNTIAKRVLATLNKQKVYWPLEFYEEFKAELITLHRHQQHDKSKVVKTMIGFHLILLLKETSLLETQEEKDASFGSVLGLTMTKKAPPPWQRRLGEEPGSGKLESIIHVTPKLPNPCSHLYPNQGQSSHDYTTKPSVEESQKHRIVEFAEIWQIPNSTSTMIDQIGHTHRRLEQLLVTFTTKASQKLIKKMDEEFYRIQVEAIRHYNQGLRLKEPLISDENAVEKGLLHSKVETLKQQLFNLNKDYKAQIEIVFDLQDKLITMEETQATLRTTQREQRELSHQMTKTIWRQKENWMREKGTSLWPNNRLHSCVLSTKSRQTY